MFTICTTVGLDLEFLLSGDRIMSPRWRLDAASALFWRVVPQSRRSAVTELFNSCEGSKPGVGTDAFHVFQSITNTQSMQIKGSSGDRRGRVSVSGRKGKLKDNYEHNLKCS